MDLADGAYLGIGKFEGQWKKRLAKEDEELQFYLNWVAAYFNQQKVQDPELLKILNKMLFRCRHPIRAFGFNQDVKL